jgi:excisionase family DNA binding protein
MANVLSKKEWLSVADAARVLGLSVGRIRQLLLAGRIEGVKLNARAWAISAASVRAFQKLDRPPGNPGFQRRYQA